MDVFVDGQVNNKNILPSDFCLGTGFGFVDLFKGTRHLIDLENLGYCNYVTLQDVETFFKCGEDISEEWRIVIIAPLHGATYIRQANGDWIMVESNPGFA